MTKPVDTKRSGKNTPKARKVDFPAGHTRGVLVTCVSPHLIKSGVREALLLLNKARTSLSSSNRSERAAQKPNEAQDVSKALQSEIADMKEESKRFIPCVKLLKGVSFIRFMCNDDVPSVFVAELFKMAREPDSFKCRFVQRMVPIDATCSPRLQELTVALTPAVAREMPGSVAAKSAVAQSGEPVIDEMATPAADAVTTWAVDLTRRSMKSLEREDVNSLCGKLVGDSKNFKVDLLNPDITIVIELNPVMCGLSLYRGVGQTRNFNLHRATNPDEKSGTLPA